MSRAHRFDLLCLLVIVASVAVALIGPALAPALGIGGLAAIMPLSPWAPRS